MSTQKTIEERARTLIDEVSLLVHDDGTGDIGVCVREALRRDPDATADEIADEIAEAIAEAKEVA